MYGNICIILTRLHQVQGTNTNMTDLTNSTRYNMYHLGQVKSCKFRTKHDEPLRSHPLTHYMHMYDGERD